MTIPAPPRQPHDVQWLFQQVHAARQADETEVAFHLLTEQAWRSHAQLAYLQELLAQQRVLTAMYQAAGPSSIVTLDQLRALGLTVAVHNDYRLNGVAHTFYLFTGPDNYAYRGEGLTDVEALAQVYAAYNRRQEQHTPTVQEG